MIPISGLYESHLTVSDLDRSISFYRDVVGLELAHTIPGRECRILLDRRTRALDAGSLVDPQLTDTPAATRRFLGDAGGRHPLGRGAEGQRDHAPRPCRRPQDG